MGRQRSFEDLQRCYLFGTTAEILERITLEWAGLQYLVLMTLEDDLDQLERFACDIMPSVRSRS